MTKFQLWLVRIIAKSVVQQGQHRHRILQFYGVLINQARKEFTEDNKQSLDSFLSDCHQEALDESKYYEV